MSKSPSPVRNGRGTQVTLPPVYRRNATRGEDLKAAQPAPVYAYVFDWKTPVLGGRLRSPHTLEVPFIFGTTDAAAALVGTGPDVATMTRATMGAWVAFARSKIFDSFPYYDFAMPRNFIRG